MIGGNRETERAGFLIFIFSPGPVWCPTMQLEVQFKRKPKPEDKEVLTSIVAPHIINGRFDCSGGVWDKDGTLLALTRYA